MTKCSICKKEAIYFRANEGRHYCKQCFIKNIEKRVKRTISKNQLIKTGDRIAVAISGGKDSLNTLFLLNKIFGKNPKVELVALSIDEGIKGYRDKTLIGTKEFCKKLGVEYHIVSFHNELGVVTDMIASKTDSSVCGSCGVNRRYLMNKKARELEATKLATGHNLDDECQSILMNILRGDLLRLGRMGALPRLTDHEKFVQRIKPLIMIPERESALYAFLNDIPATFDECPYASRNVLRKETRDFLNKLEEQSPGIKYSIVRGAERIGPIVAEKFEGEKIGTCQKCGEPSSGDICKACSLLEEHV